MDSAYLNKALEQIKKRASGDLRGREYEPRFNTLRLTHLPLSKYELSYVPYFYAIKS